MIILGIDPGTTRTGYGLISYHQSKPTCLEYGIFSQEGLDAGQRILTACGHLKDIIDKYKPDLAGIERLFFFKNQKTIMAVSEMRGAILLTLAQKGIPVTEFTPAQVKQGISAYGKAEKAQVEKMVKLLTGLKEPIRPDDAADALAIAICCANTIVF